MRVLAWPRSPSMIMSWPASRAFSTWGITVLWKPSTSSNSGSDERIRATALRRSSWRTGTEIHPEARSSPRVVGGDPDIAGTLAAPGHEQERGRPHPTTAPDLDQERGRRVRRQTPPRPRTGAPDAVTVLNPDQGPGRRIPWPDGPGRCVAGRRGHRETAAHVPRVRPRRLGLGPQRRCPAIGLRPGREAGTRARTSPARNRCCTGIASRGHGRRSAPPGPSRAAASAGG